MKKGTSDVSRTLELREHLDSSIVSITFPKNGKLRSRTVVSRSRDRVTGKYPSLKMSRMIQWESLHELNAYRLLDANPSVLAFYEQPLLIRYIQDNEILMHYPDVLVELQNCSELWEIKTAREAQKPEITLRTKLMENLLPKIGYYYRLVIAEELAREPRLLNTLKLLRLGRKPINVLEEERLRQLIEVTGYIQWASIIDGAMGPKGHELICSLVLRGLLTFDIDKHWSEETCFYWISEKNEAKNEGI